MKQKSELRQLTWLYWTSEFFNNLIFTIPVWVTFQRQFMSFSMMSLLMTIRYITSFLLELPTGAFADLFGRKVSIIVGCFLLGISYVLAAFSHDAIQFTIAMIVMSMGESFFSGANLALIFDNLKHDNATEKFPYIRSRGVFVAQIGIIVSSVFSGYLFVIWPGLPYLAQLISAVGVAMCYFFMKEYHIKSRDFSVSSYIRKTKDGFKQLVKTAYIKQLSVYYVVIAAITWSWQVFFNQIYATAIGYSDIEKGWLFGIIRLINSLLLMFVFTRSVFTKPVIFIFFPLLIIITALLAPINILALGTLLLFTMTIASSLRFSILDGYINEEFESHTRATSLSSLNMLMRLMYMGIVAVSGLFLDHYFIGYIYAGMGILAIITILPLGFKLARITSRGHKHKNASVMPHKTELLP
jgi:MFS family permease